jgi:cell shape-determining protein MreD
MNNSLFFNLVNNLSKNIFFVISVFFLINIEVSLGVFLIFNTATPSLVSIILFLVIKKFNYIPSNLNLFFIGLLNDVFLGNNLGLNSIFFLLFKYLIENININIADKEYKEDWLYFTLIFIVSFTVILLINMLLNLKIPDFGPILYYLGITLITFPIINFSINSFYFIQRLFKS